jgi:hypothetical protein
MRFGVVLLVLFAGACHGRANGSDTERSGHTRCRAVTFRPGDGWRTRSTTAGGLRIGAATTLRFNEPTDVFPGATLRHLPPDGIVVYGADYGRSSRLPRRRGLPYALAEFRHDHGWEGQPAPNVPQYVLFTSLYGHLLDVRVFFGTQDPSRGLTDRAQAELSSLRWGFCR